VIYTTVADLLFVVCVNIRIHIVVITIHAL